MGTLPPIRVPGTQYHGSGQRLHSGDLQDIVAASSDAGLDTQDARYTTADNGALRFRSNTRGDNHQRHGRSQGQRPKANINMNWRAPGSVDFWSADLPIRLRVHSNNYQGHCDAWEHMPEAQINTNRGNGRQRRRRGRGSRRDKDPMDV